MALELRDVSVYSFIKYLFLEGKKHGYPYTSCVELLRNNNINNFQELSELIESSGLDNDFLEILQPELSKISVCLNDSVGSSQMYKSGVLFEKPDMVSLTDENHFGRELLFYNSLPRRESKKTLIGNESIARIRHLLGTVDCYDWGNSLIAAFPGTGVKTVKQVFDALTRYDEQLLRQYDVMKSNGEIGSGIDLFDYQKDDKMELVVSQLLGIYEFIFSCNRDFLFGNVTDTTMKQIFSIIKSSGGKSYATHCNWLLDMACNYVTLPELEAAVDYSGRLDVEKVGNVLSRRLKKM